MIPSDFTPLGGGFYRQGHSIWELRVAEDEEGGYVLTRKQEERAVDLRGKTASLHDPQSCACCSSTRQAQTLVIRLMDGVDLDEGTAFFDLPEENTEATETTECSCPCPCHEPVTSAGFNPIINTPQSELVTQTTENTIDADTEETEVRRDIAIRQAFIVRGGTHGVLALTAGRPIEHRKHPANVSGEPFGTGDLIEPKESFSPVYMGGSFSFDTDSRDIYEVVGSSRAPENPDSPRNYDRIYKVPHPVIPYPEASNGAEWGMNDRVRLKPYGTSGAIVFVTPEELSQHFELAVSDPQQLPLDENEVDQAEWHDFVDQTSKVIPKAPRKAAEEEETQRRRYLTRKVT